MKFVLAIITLVVFCSSFITSLEFNSMENFSSEVNSEIHFTRIEAPKLIENCGSFVDSKEEIEESKTSTQFISTEEYIEPEFRLDEGGEPYLVIKTLKIRSTAYCHCEECCDKTPDDPAYGITKSGLNLLEEGADIRIVAADPKVLPLGTKIYIEVPESSRDTIYVTEDYGCATVEDTGGAIKQNRIDVYFTTHQEALEWGKRDVLVHVLVPMM